MGRDRSLASILRVGAGCRSSCRLAYLYEGLVVWHQRSRCGDGSVRLGTFLSKCGIFQLKWLLASSFEVAYFNINRAYFYVNVPRGSTGLFTDCLRLEHIVRPIHGFEQLCCEVFRFVCLKRSYFLNC